VTEGSELKILYLRGLGIGNTGPKQDYLRQNFGELVVPVLQGSTFQARIEHLSKLVKEINPDVVIGHSRGAGVALTLVYKGIWKGATLVLSGCPSGCGPVPSGVALTLVVGTKDEGPHKASAQLFKKSDKAAVRLYVFQDSHELNASLVEQNHLKGLVLETHQRQKDMTG